MENYICELCNYKTNRKYDYNKHLNTKRHKSREISLCMSVSNEKKSFYENLEKKTTKNDKNLSTKVAQMSTKRQKI